MNNNLTPFPMDQGGSSSSAPTNGFMDGFATATSSPFGAMAQSPMGSSPLARKRERDMFPGVSVVDVE